MPIHGPRKRRGVLGTVVLATILVPLLSQTLFMVLATVYILGRAAPLISVAVMSVDGQGSVTAIAGDWKLLFVGVPLSLAMGHWSNTRGRPLYGIVVIAVLIAAMLILGSVMPCGVGCASSTCGVGNVKSCSVVIKWLYMYSTCRCG